MQVPVFAAYSLGSFDPPGTNDSKAHCKTDAGVLTNIYDIGADAGVLTNLSTNPSHLVRPSSANGKSGTSPVKCNTAALWDPGDRVFPVRSHVGAGIDLAGKCVFMTADASNSTDAERVISMASHVESCGGKAVCITAKGMDASLASSISDKVHSHEADITDQEQVSRWMNTAAEKMGPIAAVLHFTGDVPDLPFAELGRTKWDEFVDRFVNTPASVLQCALESFVPGGSKDPRLYAAKTGIATIIGPSIPAGKVSGVQRARAEVFRGALRPFATTVNQELSDVLKSKIRAHLILPGSVGGSVSDNERINKALDYFLTEGAVSSAQIVHCVDEIR